MQQYFDKMLSITKGEAIGNKDFDDFQGEVTRLKKLISEEPKNLQKFEELISKFIMIRSISLSQLMEKVQEICMITLYH